ncbi:MAG TPA: hypothetical protein VLT84_10230 [Acidobacteriota bacterium]|nr:hypothetical protein [Acidobacteriota bacterium]
MTEGKSSGSSIAIIAVVALIVVAGLAIWFTSRSKPAEKRDGAAVSGSVTVGDKDEDVDIKVDLPDSVTIDAH